MPRLAGNIDLTDDLRAEMALSSNIGQNIGNALAYRRIKAKKKETETANMLFTSMLNTALKESWDGAKILEMSSEIPNITENAMYQYAMQSQQKQIIDKSFSGARDPDEVAETQRIIKNATYTHPLSGERVAMPGQEGLVSDLEKQLQTWYPNRNDPNMTPQQTTPAATTPKTTPPDHPAIDDIEAAHQQYQQPNTPASPLQAQTPTVQQQPEIDEIDGRPITKTTPRMQKLAAGAQRQFMNPLPASEKPDGSWSRTFKPTPQEMNVANILLQFDDNSANVRGYLQQYRQLSEQDRADLDRILTSGNAALIRAAMQRLKGR